MRRYSSCEEEQPGGSNLQGIPLSFSTSCLDSPHIIPHRRYLALCTRETKGPFKQSDAVIMRCFV